MAHGNMGRPLGDTRRGHALRAEFGTVASRPRGTTTTEPGRRGGEHFRSPGHVEPVTCLFSFIARCGRGAFQLSVLVSHVWVSSRGARPDTPVAGAGAIQTPGESNARGSLEKGCRRSGHCGAHASIHHAPRHILEPVLPIHP